MKDKEVKQYAKTTFDKVELGASFLWVDIVCVKTQPIMRNGTVAINAVRLFDGGFSVFADTDEVILVNTYHKTRMV